jgi:hypothetical protein
MKKMRFPRKYACWVVALVGLGLGSDLWAGESPLGDKNWLESLFPSVAQCTPRNAFYYDVEAGRSVPGLLEKLGYKVISFDKYVAYYDINENFFGIRASELMVPTHMGVYAVTLNRSASDVAKIIRMSSGDIIQIFPNCKNSGGVACLYPADKARSKYMCTTEPE